MSSQEGKRVKNAPGGPSTPTKPWASGRILTASQRARKRELDRESQRHRRQKMQSRIAELEQELRSFPLQSTSWDASAQAESLKAENERLRKFLATNQDYSGSDPWLASCSSASVTPQLPQAPVVQNTSQMSNDDTMALPTPDESLHAFIASNMPSPTEGLVSTLPILPTRQPTSIAASGQGYIVPYDEAKSDVVTNNCNQLLTRVHNLHSSRICLDDKLNQDAIIRGIIEGWDTVDRRNYCCPVWKALSFVDNMLFSKSSLVTRLTMIRTIQSMMICNIKAEPWRELPPWYRPRPAQRKFRHQVVMSYFAWPGLRERLVLGQDQDSPLLKDKWWNLFAQSFNFYWPYQLSDIYYIDPSTGMYAFSGLFLNYNTDIRTWRMDDSFLKVYPDLYEDIVPVESIPCPLDIKFPQEQRRDMARESTDFSQMNTGNSMGSNWPVTRYGPHQPQISPEFILPNDWMNGINLGVF